MSVEHDYEEVVKTFVYKELKPIMKNVVFNMSNVTVDEENINEDFIVNFFKEIRQSMNNQWKEVVKCGLEKYCNDHNLEILSKDDFENYYEHKGGIKNMPPVVKEVYHCLF